MRATDILEITMMSSCPRLVSHPMHACTLVSIQKIIGYSSLNGAGLYTRRPIGSTVGIQRGRGSAPHTFFALGSRQSIFFPSHTHTLTHIQSFPPSQYLSRGLPLPSPPSAYIRPSSLPLALMLMHSQSGCPLSRRALHVHQAVQRPACK